MKGQIQNARHGIWWVWLAVAVTGSLKVNSKPLVKYQNPSIHPHDSVSYHDHYPVAKHLDKMGERGQGRDEGGADGYLPHRYRRQSTNYTAEKMLAQICQKQHCAPCAKPSSSYIVQITAVCRLARKIGGDKKGETPSTGPSCKSKTKFASKLSQPGGERSTFSD